MGSASADDWPSLSAQLDHALELNDSERAAWLEALRQKDPVVADHVAHLLKARELTGFSQFLTGDAPMPALFESSSATLIGRSIGPYQIDAEVGRGGMGSVWRAHRTDGRYEGIVAIKFVHAAWIGRSGERRFETEGQLLGRLDHPHIARLLDAGVLEGTQPYLILEYVEGEAIDAYCERHKLGVEARVRLFLDVLAAVAHAHSHLVVHRDIKPTNVFVTRDGAVKLLDFGIAKLLAEESASGAVTRSIAIALTPQYAAPEQLLGMPISTASDVYALGLVLFVLLTGVHPFATASRSKAELIDAVARDEPPRASSVAGLKAVPRRVLEGDLDNILHRTLKKDPAERYASAGALADDLQRFLTHQPVQARPDTVRYRTQKFVRRHRAGVAAGLLTIAAVTLGFIGVVWQAQRADVNAKRADASARQAERARGRALEQLSYAEASNEFMSNLMEQGAEKPFTTPELLARGEALVNQQFKDDPALRARLLLALANLYAQVEQKTKATDLLLAAQAAARRTQDTALSLEIDCTLALEYGDQNQFERSIAMLNASIVRAQETPELDTATLAGCLDKRGQVFGVSGDPAAAVKDAEAALTTLGKPRPGQQTLALSARTTLASANSKLGNYAAAAQEYERAIDELSRLGRGQTDFAVTLLNGWGIVLSRSGQWLRAAAVYERGLAIARAVAGGGEISPMTEINYAKLLVDMGREREALPLFDTAAAAAKHRGDLNALEMVDLLSAPALCELRELDECAARLTRSGEALHKQLPPTHATLGTHETEEAQLAVARSQPQLAQDHLRSALKIFNASRERNPNELRALAIQAEVELSLGDISSADAHAEQVVEKARAALGGFPSSVWLGRGLLVRGEVLRAKGNTEGARTTLAEAVSMLHACVGDSAPWTRQARAELTRVSAPR